MCKMRMAWMKISVVCEEQEAHVIKRIIEPAPLLSLKLGLFDQASTYSQVGMWLNVSASTSAKQ